MNFSQSCDSRPFYCVYNNFRNFHNFSNDNVMSFEVKPDPRDNSRGWNPPVLSQKSTASKIHEMEKNWLQNSRKYFPKIKRNNFKTDGTRAPESKCVNTIPVMKWLIFLFLWPNSFLTLLKIKRLTKNDLLLTEDW